MYENNFMHAQRFWQRIARSSSSEVHRLVKGAEYVLHNPCDTYEELLEKIQTFEKYGYDNIEVNVAPFGDDEIPVVSYGDANKKPYKLMTLQEFMDQIGCATCVMQIKVHPSEKFIQNIRNICNEHASEKCFWISSLNLDTLQAFYDAWDDCHLCERFILNGTPFKRRNAKKWLSIMDNAGYVGSAISYTFWQNVAKVPILGLMVRPCVRRSIVAALDSGVNIQIASRPGKIEKNLKQFVGIDKLNDGVVIVYVM